MFDFRPIDFSPVGLEATRELLEVVFPDAHHITRDYLERLYFGNPLGESWGLCCFDDAGALVAHNIMIPIRARIFGRVEEGIWPFQLATHPEARMKGLFVAITEATQQEARKRGYTFLSGVGNASSSPIFVKKWGYQSICPLDAKVGIGPMPDRCPMPESTLTRIWDVGGIAWRLAHTQAAPYQVHWRGDRGHIFADTGRYGIPVEIGAFDRSELPADLPTLRAANPLRLWIGVDPSRDWSRSLYFDVPERFRPSPLNLLWYDLTGQDRRHEPDAVQYEIFDFDAY